MDGSSSEQVTEYGLDVYVPCGEGGMLVAEVFLRDLSEALTTLENVDLHSRLFRYGAAGMRFLCVGEMAAFQATCLAQQALEDDCYPVNENERILYSAELRCRAFEYEF